MRAAATAALRITAAGLIIAAVTGVAVAEPRAKSSVPRAERAKPSEIKIGLGHGLAFLPLYIAVDLKLVEKHASAAGLNGRIIWQRFASAAPMQEAITTGNLDAGAYGLSAFLMARDKARGTQKEIVAVSGLSTLPLTLLTARSNIKSLSDIKPADRIAMPLLSAPQMVMLRIQSERAFWRADKLRDQVVALPHQEAMDALNGKSEVAAYFSSPPFTQIAMREPNVRAILSSETILNGKASFLLIGSTKERVASQPKLPEVIAKAVDEASAIIRSDPRRAALIFLKFEPSRSLDQKSVEAILKGLKDEFGSPVHGVEAFAAFMGRDRKLRDVPQSWKDVVAPPLAAGQGS